MERITVAKESGFTLIELLVVLAILGILVGLVTMNVTRVPGAARRRSLDVEKEIVEKAIAAYVTHDMIGQGTTDLSARPEGLADVIRPEDIDIDAEFAKYLRGATKYAYWWEVDLDGKIAVTLNQVE